LRPPFLQRVWGADRARPVLPLRVHWTDLLIVAGLAGLLYGLLDFGRTLTVGHRPKVEIDLSPWALPHYTFLSLARGLCAYALSLVFTLLYGYWAAKDARARRVLLPLLDILQSIPVVGFMPGLILAMVALFPNSNIGLELASVMLIFTGQVWNMTFSFYQSVSSVPNDLHEAATVYRFSWWQLFRIVELPFATIGLVWNSMMSMAGGWFFLMLTETFTAGPDRDFRLPGIGSYMFAAVKAHRVDAQLWAILAMTLMIIALDQLFWRPVVVWAQKYRVEDSSSGPAATSWFLNWLRRSRLLAVGRRWLRKLRREAAARPRALTPPKTPQRHLPPGMDLLPLTVLLALLGYGMWQLGRTVWEVPGVKWLNLLESGGWTLGRVLLATAIGTIWTVPVGLAIGLSPRLSRMAQPIVQVVASFPAPMLFPLAIAFLTAAGVTLNWGSVVLMLLGTQWYILFNVIAGAMAVPADLREASGAYRFGRWQRFRLLYVPAIFPYLVTGWVTAAGGAWNASIVSEFIPNEPEITASGAAAVIGTAAGGAWDGGGALASISIPDEPPLTANGLGAQISLAAVKPDDALLAAGVLVMSLMVVTFNRTVWRRCYRLAETRYALNR
jgi:NitT/TauT family transport system permease protein